MATVQEVLSGKGSRVLTASPDTSVMEAVDTMNANRVGALVVMDGGRVSGIFTERDVLQRVVGTGRDPRDLFVGEVMTADVACCNPDDDVDDVSAIMKERRVRHVPVCEEDGGLVGIISIGDVNAQHVSRQEAHISFLSEYIYGRA